MRVEQPILQEIQTKGSKAVFGELQQLLKPEPITRGPYARKFTRKELNRSLASPKMDLIAKAEANTLRLTGKTRF